MWEAAGNRLSIAREKMETLARSPHLAGGNATVLRYILTIAFLLAVGTLEMALSGATFEELASGLLGLTAEAAHKVRYIGPWLLLVGEVFLTVTIVHLDQEQIPGEGRFSPYHLVRWGLLIMMITLTAAAQISRLPDEDSGNAVIIGFWLKMAGLVVAAGVLHTLVLYCGRHLEDAASWGIDRWRTSGLLREIRAEERTQTITAQNAHAAFHRYRHELESWNTQYPERQVQPGPFDRVTARVLNQLHNTPVIADEAAWAARAATPTPNPPAPPDAPWASRPRQTLKRNIIASLPLNSHGARKNRSGLYPPDLNHHLEKT
jgi:hypothetical protein